MTDHHSTRRRLKRSSGQSHRPIAHPVNLSEHGHAKHEHRHATNVSGTLFETSMAEAKNVVTKKIIDRVKLVVQTGLNLGHEFTEVIPHASQAEEQSDVESTEAPSLLSPIAPVSSDNFNGNLALIGNYERVQGLDNKDLIHLNAVSVVTIDTTADQPTIGRTILAIDFDNALYTTGDGTPAELPLLRTTSHLLRLMHSQVLSRSIHVREAQHPA